MSFEVVPLRPEHLEAAAAMVADRYRAAQAQIPFLPALYADPAAIVPRLDAHVGHLPGVIALDGGRPVGFLMSFLGSNRGARMAYVPDFGHAAEQGQEYDLYRQMYAQMADLWLANGCFLHGITFYPNERSAIAAWFSVGFGLAVMDAIRSVDSFVSDGLSGGDVELWRAGAGDVELVAPMERALFRHLAASPAYLPLLQSRRTELENWLADKEHALWVASRGGEAVGYLRFQPSECLVLPTSAQTTVSITGAYTRKGLRGTGIGTALLQAGLQWAGSAGYTHCSVDFESANLPGSRFWLGHFEPITHSLMRRIDPRLAWAHARRDETDLQRAFEGTSEIG